MSKPGGRKTNLRIGVSAEEEPYIHQGEKLLLKEVLLRAFNDALTVEKVNEQLCTQSERRSAQEWLFNHDEIAPFTFLWICEHLDLSADKIRHRCLTLVMRRENLEPDAGKRKSCWVKYLNRLPKIH